MNSQWEIRTQGNPLETVLRFIRTIWMQANLVGMLVPINGDAHSDTKPRLINDPGRLDEVNPFKPLMTESAAKLVPGLTKSYPGTNLGALMRPCEMRALIEMSKRGDSFEIDDIVTISVDCLGTLPADEYEWRAARKNSQEGLRDGLGQETLQFARQGGIMAYRYRSACQMCTSPEAQGADLNIFILGLPVRQYILVEARDEATAARFQLKAIADGIADADLVDQHERILARMAERNQRTMDRLVRSLGDSLPQNVDALIEQFGDCNSCRSCLDVCPICAIDFPLPNDNHRFRREEVMRWLVSCSGCGMCEQACSRHKPLSAIFGHIRNQLTTEYNYTPGRSRIEPLPIL